MELKIGSAEKCGIEGCCYRLKQWESDYRGEEEEEKEDDEEERDFESLAQ